MADDVNSPSNGTPTSTRKKSPVRRRLKPEKESREQSSIAFPYQDLETAVSVAIAIWKAGGVALSRDQLAGAMGQQPTGGSFVTKVATARLFGLIATDQGRYKLTDLGFTICDEKRRRQASAEAFLNVPLYRRVYDEFRGKQLPPRPVGLEQAFVRFGVAGKVAKHARWAFEKSASQAGFFPNGPDRLIEPILANSSSASASSNPVELEEADRIDVAPEMSRSRSTVPSGLHPFIQGLLSTLPAPESTWTVEGRAKWLQAAANIFDLIYKGNGTIEIRAAASESDGD